MNTGNDGTPQQALVMRSILPFTGFRRLTRQRESAVPRRFEMEEVQMRPSTRDADTAARRRRQIGAEKSSDPMSIMHARPSAGKILLGRIAILVTIFSWFMYVLTTVLKQLVETDNPTLRLVLETVTYLLVITVLSFSALMYLVARQGALYRFRDHQRVPRGELDRHFSADYSRGITVLIPSYIEEISVITKTVWSAALQEFPNLRVVLCIDDPPNPKDPALREQLEAARSLPEQVVEALEEPRSRVAADYASATERLKDAFLVSRDEVLRLSSTYVFSAEWLEAQARAHEIVDHMDEFFVDRVLMDLAGDLRLTVLALDAAALQDEAPDAERILQLYRRLVRIFTVRAHAFERKRYGSLSQESNKAMNLNAYISLMGHRWKREESANGVLLLPAGKHESADLIVPDSEYLLTLDADSMLLRDYCIRLVFLLEEPDNARVAVTQTPYSSYRGAPTRLERMAGATTDVQHILHQGLTFYDATFWVGANAVIRKRALDDIVQEQTVGGFTIKTYIQDRTVIEDTESSIDMGAHNWHLVNYPERLSYSATPPDFGSLIVQRRRWANGGLLIMPKFVRQLRLRRARRDHILLREILLRTNYMSSIAWASLSLILILVYPFDSRLLSLWAVAAALPYFLSMAQDLRDSGYHGRDVFSIYGFNLILLAVNVAGVIKSLQQGLTNEKIPFARTPKVENRTAAPGLYVLIPYLIIAFSAFIAWLDWRAQNWGNFAFATFNAILTAWAILAYIGIRNSIADMALGLVGWFFVPVKQHPTKPAVARRPTTQARVDWQSILYFGDRRLGRDQRRKDDLRRRITPS